MPETAGEILLHFKAAELPNFWCLSVSPLYFDVCLIMC